MKKRLLLLLSFLLTLSFLGGCTKKADDTENAKEPMQTEFRLEECGIAYRIPDGWTKKENANLIPTTFVDLEGEIYGKVEYDYAPDENMDLLNDADSDIPVEELMIPLVELLVVREENKDAASVQEELALYSNVEELPSQEGFLFFYLTTPVQGIETLSADGQKVYTELAKDLPLFRESIETFLPDEAQIQARLNEDKAFLNFISTTLEGDSIASTIFYDYDMTVVNFWASYCYPDINELETLQSFYEELQQKHPNVNFVQVIIDTPGTEAETIVAQAYEEAGVTFTGIMPDENMASWIINNLNGLPTTVFVDNTGKPTAEKIEGIKDQAAYMEKTESMLETMPIK